MSVRKMGSAISVVLSEKLLQKQCHNFLYAFMITIYVCMYSVMVRLLLFVLYKLKLYIFFFVFQTKK